MSRLRVCWSLLALLLLPCLLSSAPAPKAQKAKPLTMLGDFTERWNGTDYAAWFRDDATCGAVSGDDRWRGTWELKGRTLYVTEGMGGAWLSWDVELDGGLSGVAVVRAAGRKETVGQTFKVRFTAR